MDIQLNGGSHVLYANIQPEMVARRSGEHVVKQQPVREWLICRMADGDVPDDEPQAIQNLPQFRDLPFTGKQVRIALRQLRARSTRTDRGLHRPRRLPRAGQGARQMVAGRSDPARSRNAGLRGRGGGGFSDRHQMGTLPQVTRRARNTSSATPTRATPARSWTARFWRAIRTRDRRHGHRRATRSGAREGYHLLPRGISARRSSGCKPRSRRPANSGLLGENILGTEFGFRYHDQGGAGAFVCGEETALIASIEGRRGEPRPRPPFPAVSGPVGQADATSTTSRVTPCRRASSCKGAAWFANIGSAKSPGHGDLRTHRQGQQHRPDRSADGHSARRHHLRCRRRHPQGQARSKPCRPAARSAAACRRRRSTPRWISIRSRKPAR